MLLFLFLLDVVVFIRLVLSVFFLAFGKVWINLSFSPHPPPLTKKKKQRIAHTRPVRDALIEERDICIYKDRILIIFDVPFSLRKQCFWCRTDR